MLIMSSIARQRYILTVLDMTTRWIEALPMTEASATSCCQSFITGWIQRFGLPKLITSDNCNTFIAKLWKEMHQALGIEVAYTPPYHSSSLGAIERRHRAIKIGLKTSLFQMADEVAASGFPDCHG